MDGHRPFRVARARAQPIGVTPVDFHVVDAPLREPAGIPELVAQACRQALTRSCPGVGVDAEPQTERVDPEAIGGLPIRAASGVTVPLHDLAKITLTEGRTSIIHDGARRRQVVTVNPQTTDIAGFVTAAREAIQRHVKLPQTVYLEYVGAAQGAG